MKNCISLLSIISEKYYNILGENLVGIYIHGSIAFNCFNWDKSDIDFIVVIQNKLSQEEKLNLLKVLESLQSKAPPKGFEMSVVLLKYCIDFVYPTPYELHFSNMWIDKYMEEPLSLCNDEFKTDNDLVAHFTIIKNVGIVLYGETIETVFGEIPRESFLDSIRLDLQNVEDEIKDNPIYFTLNLCRIYAYLKDNLILSKEQGAIWGLNNTPKEYHELLSNILICYKSEATVNEDDKNINNYCKYMLTKILYI